MAARIYDCFAIISHGLRAKTNFSYKKSEILSIVQEFGPEYILDPHKSQNLIRKLRLSREWVYSLIRLSSDGMDFILK